MKTLIEQLPAFDGKNTGTIFQTENLETFAQQRCDELNSTPTAKEFKHLFEFRILGYYDSPNFCWEAYKEIRPQGRRIEIYRNFKK
jgi:hypothetical protein